MLARRPGRSRNPSACPPLEALILDVGKRCGQKSTAQEEIHALLIEQARAGRSVVRLQGGDPLIFGRAGEEIAALREAGVAFEIVPGVTAASAAAAAAQITLTDRRRASRLIFLSAHRRAGQFDAAWKSLPVLRRHASDLHARTAITKASPENCATPASHPETPCLLVSQASTAEQKVLRTNLASLADVQAAARASASPGR